MTQLRSIEQVHFSDAFRSRKSSNSPFASLPAGSAHESVSLAVSSCTISTEILPPNESVAMRATAAFRSRKLPFQAAAGDNAKSRNLWRASLLNVMCLPVFLAYRSSSN